MNGQKRRNNQLWVDFLIEKLKYINVLLLLRDRHIIVSHYFSFSKSSKRCLNFYLLYIVIICGNIELNPGFTSSPGPKNVSIILSFILSNYFKSKGMKILHLNARSLSSKKDKIRLDRRTKTRFGYSIEHVPNGIIVDMYIF